MLQIVKPGINIDFVGRMKKAFIFSGSLILLSILSLILRGGPNYGVDFAGGIVIQVAFKDQTTTEAVRDRVGEVNLLGVSIQRFGEASKNEFLIRAQLEEKRDMSKLGDEVLKTLEKKYGQGKVEIRQVEMVGPKVGADLRNKALMALYFAILFMAVYISGRFEMKWLLSAVMAGALIAASVGLSQLGLGWTVLILAAIVVTLVLCWFLKLKYALGAIVALIHDVIITVGLFSLTDKEFTLPTVAALLTIIGYSVNDTIIVFDRIRENMAKARRQDFGTVINRAVNETLSRTLLTSGTTLLVVVALFILGGGIIHDFAFALLVGITIGTYSSVFVASPILLLFPESSPRPAAAPQTAAPQAETSPALSPTRPSSRKSRAQRKKARR